MIARVIGGKALPPAVLQHVATKTDGVPLFVEELTKTVLESGLLQETQGHYELTAPLPPLAIPATLHDSLMARLDRLATVKAVAQLGAVLGRTFSYEVLQAVTTLDEAPLQQALARHADTAIALATEQDFTQWVAQGTIMRGWALAMQGQDEAGMAHLRQGITVRRATGAAVFVPYSCTLLAEISDHLGRTEDALQVLAEVHTLVEQHEER